MLYFKCLPYMVETEHGNGKSATHSCMSLPSTSPFRGDPHAVAMFEEGLMAPKQQWIPLPGPVVNGKAHQAMSDPSAAKRSEERVGLVPRFQSEEYVGRRLDG